jgi:TonB family protein
MPRRNRPLLSAAALVAITALAAPAFAQPVTPPQVVEHVDAAYPEARLADGVESNVVLFVTVEKDGTVSDAKVAESGGDDFDNAALEAVKRWRFAPAIKEGQPVRARIRVPFHFAPGPHVEPPPEKKPEQKTEKKPEEPPKPEAPSELPSGTNLPHAVVEPGKPIEIHVQGKPNPPRVAASDFRIDTPVLTAAPHGTASDLLETAPGFLVVHPEGAASAQRVVIRGFDADHGQDVEFSVGAIPVNQISHLHGQGYADLNVVIPETVRSLRVVEGIYDPMQGDFAVAASVDYDLGVAERGLRFKATAGSFGTVRGLALWAPEGQAEETFAAAVVQRSDGFGMNRQGETAGLTGQYKFQLPGETTALLHFAAYAARSGLAGAIRRDDIDAGRIGFYDTYNDPSALAQSATTSRSQVSITVEHTAENGAQTTAAVWGAYATYRARLNFTGYTLENPAALGTFPGDLGEQGNFDGGLGGRMMYRSRRFEANSWLSAQLHVGTTARAHSIDQSQDRLTEPDNVTWERDDAATVRVAEIGAFADLSINATKYVHLRGGVRADFAGFDVDDKLAPPPPGSVAGALPGDRKTAAGVAGAPRATLEVDPTTWLRLLGSAGLGHRTPEALQLKDGQSVPFTTVQSYELGLRLADRGLVSLTAAAFITKLSQDLSFEALEGSFTTIGPTTRKGVVAYFQAAPTEGLTSSVSFTGVQATLDNPDVAAGEGKKVPFIPPVVIRADVGYKRAIVPLWNKPLEGRIGYGATFLSPRPLTDTLDSPAVFVVDATAGIKRDNVEIGVDIYNLFNQKYAEQEYFYASNWRLSPANPAIPVEHISPGAPFTCLVSLTLTL